MQDIFPWYIRRYLGICWTKHNLNSLQCFQEIWIMCFLQLDVLILRWCRLLNFFLMEGRDLLSYTIMCIQHGHMCILHNHVYPEYYVYHTYKLGYHVNGTLSILLAFSVGRETTSYCWTPTTTIKQYIMIVISKGCLWDSLLKFRMHILLETDTSSKSRYVQVLTCCDTKQYDNRLLLDRNCIWKLILPTHMEIVGCCRLPIAY